LRGRNSWRLLLAEVSSVELLEVQLINAVAPFIINARLKSLMMRTPERDNTIVNVSAVEGQFYRNGNTPIRIPTCQAALNMMTRPRQRNIRAMGSHEQRRYRWVTDEDPLRSPRERPSSKAFNPPLDIVDVQHASSIPSSVASTLGTRVGTVLEGLSADRLVDPAPR